MILQQAKLWTLKAIRSPLSIQQWYCRGKYTTLLHKQNQFFSFSSRYFSSFHLSLHTWSRRSHGWRGRGQGRRRSGKLIPAHGSLRRFGSEISDSRRSMVVILRYFLKNDDKMRGWYYFGAAFNCIFGIYCSLQTLWKVSFRLYYCITASLIVPWCW